MPVASPEKELRFTRAHQARVFAVIGAMSFCTALLIALTAWLFRADHPELPSAWWSLPALALVGLCHRAALHCVRHAYIILSPVGVEIFPLIRPERNMRLVPWAQITEAEFSKLRLTLHYNAEHTAGIHLSLRPLSPLGRLLLEKAILGRLKAD